MPPFDCNWQGALGGGPSNGMGLVNLVFSYESQCQHPGALCKLFDIKLSFYNFSSECRLGDFNAYP